MRRLNIWSILTFLTLLTLACTLTPIPTPVTHELAAHTPKTATLPPTDVPNRQTITTKPTATPYPTCAVTATALNVRTCAGVECEVSEYLVFGDIASVHQASDNWLNISTTSGVSGWINSTYCTRR
jgi:uncharacterized protein YgiM (DUF1202 family)